MTFQKRLRLKVEQLHQRFFARRIFYSFHELLYLLSLRGMGVFNYENEKVSGEENFLRRYLAILNNPTILDVGANHGNYSRLCKAFAPQSQLFAFEPHPTTFESLKSVAAELNFVAVCAACGDAVGALHFFDYAGSTGTSHATLYREVIEKLHRGQSTSMEVEGILLDTFLEEHNITRINLLKIDTEGHELAVLRGVSRALAKKIIDLIQFEFNDTSISARTFFQDFVAMLPGFTFYRLLPDGLAPIRNYPRVYSEIFGFQNIIAASPETNPTLRAVFRIK